MSMWNLKFAFVAMLLVTMVFGDALTVCVVAQQLQPSQQNSNLKEPAKHPLPNELKPAMVINRRYQEMLQQNQVRGESRVSDQVFPGSYDIHGSANQYVRRQLPNRLIPPGRVETPVNSPANPYRLNAPPQGTAPVVGGLPQPVSGYRQSAFGADNATAPFPSSHGINTNLNSTLSRPDVSVRRPTNSMNRVPPFVPPIVQPTKSMIQPPQFPAKSYQRPNHRIERGQIIRTSHTVESDEIRRSSLIPTGSDDQSKLTKARFVMVQESGDPFGQAPQNPNRASGNAQDDPFADPDAFDPQRESNQSSDPFADPPEGFGTQDVQDPFADPPEDVENGRQTTEPFGNQPNKIQETDPFPINPNDIRPRDRFDVPDDAGQPRIPLTVDPEGDAPGVTAQGEPILGAFKPRQGFSPKRILPAPPRREFQGAITYETPAYPSLPDFYAQPSYFGTDFDKSLLYEGITAQAVSDAYNGDQVVRGPNTFARRRIFNRSCRNSQCSSPSCRGCDPIATGQRCDTCDGNGWIDRGNDPVGCIDCLENCFEPMFYLSVFGGYTQLESIGPFGVPNNIIADGPVATVFLNDGFGLGLALGQYQGPNLRTEIEFAYRSNSADSVFESAFTNSTIDIDGTISSFSGMFNMLWDFQSRPIFGRYQPYAGAGIGFSFIDIGVPENSFIEDNENQSSFAYQLMAGISRPIACQMEGFVEYRYFNADPIRILAASSVGNAEYATENIFFGLRIQF